MDDKKEFYRLWWEYLRRSEKYEAYCKRYNDFRNDKDHDHRAEEIFTKYRPGIKEYYEMIFGGPLDEELLHLHISWGDVFKNSFNNWWVCHSSLPEWEEKSPAVTDFTKQIKGNVLLFAEWFERENGRQPSVEDIAYGLPEWLEMIRPEHIFLAVNYDNPQATASIQKKVLDYLNKKRIENKDRVMMMRKVLMLPATRVRDELKLYLKVYDLTRAGMKIGEVILKLGGAADRERFDDPYVQRVWLRYKDKAEKVISNVEKGLFPVTSDK